MLLWAIPVFSENSFWLIPRFSSSSNILSDIVIEKATADEVTFVAILSTPDTYTSYHINIVVNNTDGTVKMSV